jgi:hypothetical protein
MSNVCGNILLSNDLLASCGPVGGIGEKIYAYNWNDCTLTFDADGNITAIGLSACAKGYVLTTRREANQFTSEGALVNGAPFQNQSVILRGGISTPEQRQDYNQLTKANRLLLVTENNGNEASRFLVHGAANGLRMTASTDQSNQNPADLAGFELTLGGADTDVPAFLQPAGATTYATQLAYLEGTTINRVVRGITRVLPGPNGYTFSGAGTANQIDIVGCGFTGYSAGNVVVGGRATNPVTGGTYTSTVAVVNDNLLRVTIVGAGDGGSTSGTTVSIVLPSGTVTFTSPTITIVGNAA